MRKILLILALIGLSAKIFAQEDKERNEKIELMKIGFITQKLNLTSDEAKLFWPVYNELRAEQKKLHEKKKVNITTYKSKVAPTSIDANKFISDQFSFKQSGLDLKKKYITEFKKVLPESKVAILFILEDEFKQLLLQKLFKEKEKKDI